jgi:BirA family biotin operon repressor/biotin-[acetyl-CoA-carboxylase] ligase
MTLDRALLESELHQIHLPIPVSPPNIALHLFDTVDSTNSIAWNLLKQTPSQPVVAIAQSQTAGRGQRGNHWQSDIGGLYLSLGINLDLPATHAALLTLTSAWGIAIGLRQRQIPVQLKWLNDLVMHGRKLGGILTESRIQQGRIYQAVIGVGMNWKNTAPETGISLQTVFQKPGIPRIDRLETLAAIVIQSIFASLAYWQPEDINTFLLAYESLLVNIGQSVTSQNTPGQVLGITAAGELRVKLQPVDGRAIEVCLQPGEIHLGYRSGTAIGSG